MKLVRVPLRISLCGGGSDIPSHYETFGGAVVSFAINKYIYITAKPWVSLFPHKYRLVYSRVEKCQQDYEIVHPIIRQLVENYGHKSLDLDVMSDVPAGTGLGSSSAFTAGLHLALSDRGESGYNKFALAEDSCDTEIIDLGEPIGKQDQYAAVFGGLNLIEFSKTRTSVSPLCLSPLDKDKLQSNLYLIYIGGQRSASRLLKKQNKQDNSEALCQMAGLARNLAHSLRQGVIDDVGPYIKANWELKRVLSPEVSNPLVDKIIDTALSNGATGGKLLGAGGAGFVLLYCPRNKSSDMMGALGPMNLTYIHDWEIDDVGAKILYQD